MSTLQKIAKITQAVLDQVTGADLPTLYYHPHGEIRRVLDYRTYALLFKDSLW